MNIKPRCKRNIPLPVLMTAIVAAYAAKRGRRK
jgi:hypothetical protein